MRADKIAGATISGRICCRSRTQTLLAFTLAQPHSATHTHKETQHNSLVGKMCIDKMQVIHKDSHAHYIAIVFMT